MITSRPQIFVQRPVLIIPESIKGLYGRGMRHPMTLAGNYWELASGEEKIHISIFVILLTPIGTRLQQPDFGSMLPYMVFQRIDDTFRREILSYTRDAIMRWETRISVTRAALIESNIDNNEIGISLEYLIKGTMAQGRFLLPIKLENAVQAYAPSSAFTVGGRRVIQ